MKKCQAQQSSNKEIYLINTNHRNQAPYSSISSSINSQSPYSNFQITNYVSNNGDSINTGNNNSIEQNNQKNYIKIDEVDDSEQQLLKLMQFNSSTIFPMEIPFSSGSIGAIRANVRLFQKQLFQLKQLLINQKAFHKEQFQIMLANVAAYSQQMSGLTNYSKSQLATSIGGSQTELELRNQVQKLKEENQKLEEYIFDLQQKVVGTNMQIQDKVKIAVEQQIGRLHFEFQKFMNTHQNIEIQSRQLERKKKNIDIQKKLISRRKVELIKQEGIVKEKMELLLKEEKNRRLRAKEMGLRDTMDKERGILFGRNISMEEKLNTQNALNWRQPNITVHREQSYRNIYRAKSTKNNDQIYSQKALLQTGNFSNNRLVNLPPNSSSYQARSKEEATNSISNRSSTRGAKSHEKLQIQNEFSIPINNYNRKREMPYTERPGKQHISHQEYQHYLQIQRRASHHQIGASKQLPKYPQQNQENEMWHSQQRSNSRKLLREFPTVNCPKESRLQININQRGKKKVKFAKNSTKYILLGPRDRSKQLGLKLQQLNAEILRDLHALK